MDVRDYGSVTFCSSFHQHNFGQSIRGFAFFSSVVGLSMKWIDPTDSRLPLDGKSSPLAPDFPASLRLRVSLFVIVTASQLLRML
mmetsp:Transcript_8526/g.12458  ORF Transcript_8526/g.12458 Transcript_8526/m.12458 type:complete len:85 (+) Transcript_8526:47-301(+)